MNLDNLPSKSEVMCWNTDRLADFLKGMGLNGCDKVVKKNGINGPRLLAMSNSDFKKFPKVHVAMITNICSEINHSDKQKALTHRPTPSLHPRQDFGYAPQTSAFDQDSEPEYEDPHAEDFDDNYICAMSDQGPRHNKDSDSDGDYEPPPCEDIPNHFPIAKPMGDGDYIDSIRNAPSKDQTPRPPQRPGTTDSYPYKSSDKSLAAKPSKFDPPSQRPPPGRQAGPPVDRSRKPNSLKRSKQNQDKSEMASHPPDLRSQSMNSAHQAGFSFGPGQQNLMTHNSSDMDPQWYAGPMTRGEAENCLRQINRDGTFLIRDSSKNFSDQPYTLMILKEHKVYNIQIRFHGNKEGYSLGTGLMGTEKFGSVREIVTHYTTTYLQLIDALDRASGAQCCLMYPAMG